MKTLNELLKTLLAQCLELEGQGYNVDCQDELNLDLAVIAPDLDSPLDDVKVQGLLDALVTPSDLIYVASELHSHIDADTWVDVVSAFGGRWVAEIFPELGVNLDVTKFNDVKNFALFREANQNLSHKDCEEWLMWNFNRWVPDREFLSAKTIQVNTTRAEVDKLANWVTSDF